MRVRLIHNEMFALVRPPTAGALYGQKCQHHTVFDMSEYRPQEVSEAANMAFLDKYHQVSYSPVYAKESQT